MVHDHIHVQNTCSKFGHQNQSLAFNDHVFKMPEIADELLDSSKKAATAYNGWTLSTEAVKIKFISVLLNLNLGPHMF